MDNILADVESGPDVSGIAAKTTIGRPTKLDDLSERKILDAVRAGNTRRAASEAAGIAASTFFSWCDRGRKGEEPFSEFVERLKRAEAEAEIAAVATIRAASEKSWQAAAWFLERRHAEWRPPQIQAQHEVEHFEPVLSPEAQAALQARLAEYEPLQLPAPLNIPRTPEEFQARAAALNQSSAGMYRPRYRR